MARWRTVRLPWNKRADYRQWRYECTCGTKGPLTHSQPAADTDGLKHWQRKHAYRH